MKETVLSLLTGFFLANIINFVIKSMIPSLRIFIAKEFKNTEKYVSLLIQDPIVKNIVMQAIAQAFREAGSQKGEERFKQARRVVLRVVPDIYDDAADMLLQAVYDEIKNTEVITNGK
jgi:hypothetical protein